MDLAETLVAAVQLAKRARESLGRARSKEVQEVVLTLTSLQQTLELLAEEGVREEHQGLRVCVEAAHEQLLRLRKQAEAYVCSSASELEATSRLFQRDLLLSGMNDQMKALFLSHEEFGDDAAADFWRRHFGSKRLVDSRVFVERYTEAAETAAVSEEAHEVLERYLDFARVGHVSVYAFRVFLRSFGPLTGSARRLLDAVDAGILAGHISAIEASSLLSGRPKGCYLVRFSKSRPGSFAVTFVDSKLRVKHCLLYAVGPRRYGLTLKKPADVFQSLGDFVVAHRSRLSVPMANLVKQRKQLTDSCSSPGPYTRYLGRNLEDDDDDSNMCCVCYDEVKDQLFMPCGHLAVGSKCAKKMTECCVCRSAILSKVKVFHA